MELMLEQKILEKEIMEWIKKVKQMKGINEFNDENKEDFQLKIGGSQILETNTFLSDMDILCILPKYVNIYDFNGEDGIYGLYGRLLLNKEINVNIVQTSRILMIELKIYGIDVDLIYAQIPFKNVTNNFDIMNNEIIEENKNKQSILALAGFRSTIKIKEMNLNQKLFISLMRFLKIWAKNRLIYSNIAGYLSGSSLAIMSAKICIIYPNASLPIAIKQFFIFYKLWGWPQPILLNELENEFKKAKEIVEPWKWINKEDNSEFENDFETDSNDELEEEKEGNDGKQMSIITSGVPEQNTTFNVNKFTFKRIIKEIERANEIINKTNNEQESIWEELIEELNWENNYEYFILILCKVNENVNCNKQKVLLRTYLYNWEKENEQNNLIKESQLITNYEKNVECFDKNSKRFLPFL
uniref:polynucleotide adenylyltransferase n=1 Tax=Meloidogyne enterolobii TaxID=390850 RepID=A0A6V7VIM9_MELEN|nr:unnamed protein product [Meloidogyne enterolobii]